jgi:DNA primase
VIRVSLDARKVKATCDFLAIAKHYTRLRRAGRQYVGLCAFHRERHASLYIHPERKLFHCFGCGAGGDVFEFIMRAEGCDFRCALKIAAFGFGVAAVSEGRRPERPDGGVGAEPLKAAKRPACHSQSNESERQRVLARFDETERRRERIRRTNWLSSVSLAMACEPLNDEGDRGAGRRRGPRALAS